MEEKKLFAVARSILQKKLGALDAGDVVRIEPRPTATRIAYVSTRDSQSSRDVTCLECRVESYEGQMWIDRIHVASPLRHHGLGTQLVSVAEDIASSLGLRTVNAFPLERAKSFWEKIGYSPHPRKARVVTKDLASTPSETPGRDMER